MLTAKYKLTVKIGHEMTLTDYYMSDAKDPDFADAVMWAQHALDRWRGQFPKMPFDSITLTCNRRY